MAMPLKLNCDVTHNEDLFLASSSGSREEILLTMSKTNNLNDLSGMPCNILIICLNDDNIKLKKL